MHLSSRAACLASCFPIHIQLEAGATYHPTIEGLMAESSRRGPLVPYDGLVIVPRRDGITSREAGAAFARRANAAGGTRVSLVSLDVVAHDVLRSSARERSNFSSHTVTVA